MHKYRGIFILTHCNALPTAEMTGWPFFIREENFSKYQPMHFRLISSRNRNNAYHKPGSYHEEISKDSTSW